MESKADKIKSQLEADKYGILMVDKNTNYQISPHEEPVTVKVFLKDGSAHEFENVKTETFYDNAGGLYSVTLQSNKTYIFPMNSINYIKAWLPKEEEDGK